MGNAAYSTRRPAKLAFDNRKVDRGRGRHGPAVTPGDAAMTGADAAGGDTRAGANVGLGDGDGFGATCAATCTDDHNRPYHGCDARACAAADADAAGVGDKVT